MEPLAAKVDSLIGDVMIKALSFTVEELAAGKSYLAMDCYLTAPLLQSMTWCLTLKQVEKSSRI